MLKKRRACEQLRVWSYRRLPEHGVNGGGAGGRGAGGGGASGGGVGGVGG